MNQTSSSRQLHYDLLRIFCKLYGGHAARQRILLG